jgi:hypothetical protein
MSFDSSLFSFTHVPWSWVLALIVAVPLVFAAMKFLYYFTGVLENVFALRDRWRGTSHRNARKRHHEDDIKISERVVPLSHEPSSLNLVGGAASIAGAAAAADSILHVPIETGPIGGPQAEPDVASTVADSAETAFDVILGWLG